MILYRTINKIESRENKYTGVYSYVEIENINVNIGGVFCFFQAEDGIRDLVRSRGLGDVYKRQMPLDAWPKACILRAADFVHYAAEFEVISNLITSLSLIHI